MTALPSVQQHPASVDAYIRHGWSLVPIPAGTKGPRTPGWNKKESALKSQNDLIPGFGIGLAHAYSSTMAFDIDNWDATVAQGIDLQALYDAPDAVVIESGKAGHGKLLYQMPFGLAPVPGDAGGVVDNGELLARQPVEQRRFADIRTANDGEGEGHGQTFR